MVGEGGLKRRTERAAAWPVSVGTVGTVSYTSRVTIWMMSRLIVTPSGQRGLSLAQQALGLRRLFPATSAVVRSAQLVWVAALTPTPLSRAYAIRVTYSVGENPRVAVVDPPLLPDADGYLPHFYSREGCLCLHEVDEWNPSMLIAATIVPWTTEWLAHYELWKRTGQWYGDADLPEGAPTSEVVPADAGGTRTRAERRRHGQRDARRARPPR